VSIEKRKMALEKREVAEQKQFGALVLHFTTTLYGIAPLPFVLSTEAYPDFLLRAACDDHLCGSP